MRARAIVAMVVVCVLGAARVGAQGLDGERFVPATGVEGGFVLEHPAVPFHLGWNVALFANVADDPVVNQGPNNTVLGRPVDTAGTLDLLGSIGLFGRVELGVHLPIHLLYNGDPYMTGATTLSASGGVGDLRFVPKVALVRKGSLDRHVLLSFALPVSLPTGNSLAIRGAGGVTLLPELLFAVHFGRLGILLDGGYRYRSKHPAMLPWGDEITFGGGLVYVMTEHLAGRVELIGAKEIGASVPTASLPLEVIGGLTYARGSWEVYGGGGLGLTDGIGAPDFRIIAGVRFRKHVEARQGFGDSDGDGVMDKDDKCPNEPEDTDGFEDEDGCPDLDNDHDGIPDAEDECPELAGDLAHHGCPAKTYVKIDNGRIIVFGKVQFRTGSAEIDPKSAPLLDQIAEALNANPHIKHIEVQGHTDNVGGARMNQQLSEERARAVKSALEKRKVDGDRLHTRGYGESSPIAPNKSPGGRAKNRRVEFILGKGGS
jgi:outer membrane protein OmpA-like peptidoglycan-associated protein